MSNQIESDHIDVFEDTPQRIFEKTGFKFDYLLKEYFSKIPNANSDVKIWLEEIRKQDTSHALALLNEMLLVAFAAGLSRANANKPFAAHPSEVFDYTIGKKYKPVMQ